MIMRCSILRIPARGTQKESQNGVDYISQTQTGIPEFVIPLLQGNVAECEVVALVVTSFRCFKGGCHSTPHDGQGL